MFSIKIFPLLFLILIGCFLEIKSNDIALPKTNNTLEIESVSANVQKLQNLDSQMRSNLESIDNSFRFLTENGYDFSQKVKADRKNFYNQLAQINAEVTVPSLTEQQKITLTLKALNLVRPFRSYVSNLETQYRKYISRQAPKQQSTEPPIIKKSSPKMFEQIYESLKVIDDTFRFLRNNGYSFIEQIRSNRNNLGNQVSQIMTTANNPTQTEQQSVLLYLRALNLVQAFQSYIHDIEVHYRKVLAQQAPAQQQYPQQQTSQQVFTQPQYLQPQGSQQYLQPQSFYQPIAQLQYVQPQGSQQYLQLQNFQQSFAQPQYAQPQAGQQAPLVQKYSQQQPLPGPSNCNNKNGKFC